MWGKPFIYFSPSKAASGLSFKWLHCLVSEAFEEMNPLPPSRRANSSGAWERWVETGSQSSSLQTVWRLRNWEVKLKEAFEEEMLSVIRGWLGLAGSGERLTCLWQRRSRWGFMVLITARLSGAAALGSAFLQAKNGQDQGEEDAPGEFIRKLRSWRKAQALQNTLGCFPRGWFAVASGHHTRLKLGTETTVCLIWDRFKLEMRRFFLISNQITEKTV